MQAMRFTAQPFDGGPEVSYYEIPPARLRAAAAFKGDPAYEELDQSTRNYMIGTAFAILSAKGRGLSAALDLPERVTVASCEEFATKYMIAAADSELSTERGEDVEENPTGTPPELS